MKNNEQTKKGLNELYEITSDTAQMYTFGSTLNESNMQDDDVNENNESQETAEEKKIKAGWEYKIYKLDINGVAPLKGDFMKAKNKIEGIPKLKNLIKNDFQIENLLPLIIKESRMDNSQVSSTGAKGYLQITPRALDDINKTYKLEDLNLNRGNPVDNLIIGVLYRKRNMEIINAGLKKIGKDGIFSEKDKNELNILSYNIGPVRMLNLLDESGAKSLGAFKEYIRKTLGCKLPIKKKKDPFYKVEYKDLLDGKKKEDFEGGENQKLAEGLRYIEVINGLQSYLDEEMQITSIGTINSDNGSLFSQVKALRDKKIFRENANINQICKIILETNGYKENETPKGVNLILIKEALQDFLN